MKTFLAFILGGVIGFLAYWYLDKRDLEISTGRVVQTNNVDAIQGSTHTENSIKDELARTGRVIRENAKEAGGAITAVADNTRITADIKAKLVKDPVLSAVAIDVDTAQGVVTLSGTVPSYEQISNAIQLALATKGVQKVVSQLQVAEARPVTK